MKLLGRNTIAARKRSLVIKFPKKQLNSCFFDEFRAKLQHYFSLFYCLFESSETHWVHEQATRIIAATGNVARLPFRCSGIAYPAGLDIWIGEPGLLALPQAYSPIWHSSSTELIY